MVQATSRAANAFGPSFGPSTRDGANGGTRELTAEQLTGSSPDVVDNVPRTRRSRRARRRASQISTHSLPAYMKEPGDTEVVIIRGPEDLMEDSPTTAHVVMPSVPEGAESPELSVDLSRVQSRDYTEVPDSPHDMPLLSGEDSRADMGPDMDNSRAHLVPPGVLSSARPSVDTLPMTEEILNTPNIPSRRRSQGPDPRGDAPPYFEVVALDDLTPSHSPVIPSHDEHPSPESSPDEPVEPRRRSVFLSLFHPRHNQTRAPPIPAQPASNTSHRRDASNVSTVSNASTPSLARPRSRAQSRAGTHRPSQSASGFSIISRSRSRLLDSPHLTSPSTVSINSISAPLTHTTIRTEFTYPRSGPTPDQIRLIASRESFARFGVPYGEDAIAFHASQTNLPTHPPPEFEEVAGMSRSPSAADANHDDTPVEVEDSEAHATEGDEDAVHEQVHNGSPLASEPVNGEAASSATTNHQHGEDSFSTPKRVSTPPGLGRDTDPSELSEPSTSSAVKPKPAPLPLRAESRASSLTSFATAEESLGLPSPAATPFSSASSKQGLPRLQVPVTEEGSVTPSTISEPSTPQPSTPRIPPTHLHENTDTTVTLSPSTPTSAATEVGRAL